MADTNQERSELDSSAAKPVDAATAKPTSASEAKSDAAEKTGTSEGQNPNANGTANGDALANKDVEPTSSEQVQQEENDSKPTESASEHASKASGSGRSNHRHPSFRERYHTNNKFDPSTQTTSSDPAEIRKQVEFYFSDSNLPMDKFLLDQVGGVENKPVEIKTLHNFKRMRRFQPYSAIIAALKDSTVLEVVDQDKVKRKVPIEQAALGKSVEEGQKWVEDKTLSRSIYAKGFGEETPSTQFEIEAFFAPYGPTNAIRLRRVPVGANSGVFKSSVFVEFADDATQQAFMALDPKPKWKGSELLWKTKKDYVEDKAADIAAGRVKPRKPWQDRKKGGSGGPDPDDWKKRRDEDQKRGFGADRGRNHGHGRDGGGRGRGGRGGRGGREQYKVPETGPSKPETAGKIPSADKSESAPATKTEKEAPSSKKRGRDEDEADEPSRKKVEVEVAKADQE